MFSSIGWFEIFIIVLLGLVIVGPERLPGVIEDIRAAIFAARKAINNAKAELNGEFEEFGKEFDSIRQPLSQAAEWTSLGPRGMITKALFDGDESALDDFDFAHNKHNKSAQQPRDFSQTTTPDVAATPQTLSGSNSSGEQRRDLHGNNPQPQPPVRPEENNGGGGFSWADIT